MHTKIFERTSVFEINTKKPRTFHPVLHSPSFIYIGNDNRVKRQLLKILGEGFLALNLEEATDIVKLNSSKNIINIIFLDIPYNRVEISRFANLFKQLRNSNQILVIYNECKVGYHSKELRKFQFIDDVFNLDDSYLLDRIDFLRTTKVSHHSLRNNEVKMMLLNGFQNQAKYISKRILDLVISCSALVILLPILLLIALLIKLDSKGPIIYTSKRAGKGYKVFEFYKFRTMEVNADKKIDALSHLNQYDIDSCGPKFFKLNNDPRVTRIGKFLRNTSLDELPQLINVIKGDMSIVGNRPLPLYEAATLTTNEYIERFMAPSGITGLWQIMKRGKPMMSTQERVELDIRYARSCNIFHDLWIIIKTPAALFQKTSV